MKALKPEIDFLFTSEIEMGRVKCYFNDVDIVCWDENMII